MRSPFFRSLVSAALGLCVVSLSPDTQAGGEAVEIDLAEFAKAWKADARAVQKMYNGKVVRFTGPVAGFGFYAKLGSSIQIECQPGESRPRIVVRTKDAEPWTTYGLGQTVTVRGVFNATLGAIVEDATITTQERNPTVTVKASDLAADAIPSRDEAAKKYLNQGRIVVGEVVKVNDQKDMVYLNGKDAVLIECLTYPVLGEQLGASLTVGSEARIFGVVREQLSPLLDSSKHFRLRDCFPILKAKKN